MKTAVTGVPGGCVAPDNAVYTLNVQAGNIYLGSALPDLAALAAALSPAPAPGVLWYYD